MNFEEEVDYVNKRLYGYSFPWRLEYRKYLICNTTIESAKIRLINSCGIEDYQIYLNRDSVKLVENLFSQHNVRISWNNNGTICWASKE